jgi:choline dehydrogenase-like flavoprotein
LLLSGIGDKNFLDSLGIGVVSDVPGVGQNFQDHPGATPNAMFLNDLNPSPNNVTNSTWLAEQRVLYDTAKKGIPSCILGVTTYWLPQLGVWTTSAANSAAFLPLHLFTNRTDEFISTLQRQDISKYLPNTHPTLIAGVTEQHRLLIKGARAKNIAFAEYANGGSAATPLVLQKPFSRGSVLINSTDPFADPVVNFGVFTNPVDIEVMLEIFKTWRKLLTLPSWKVLNPVEYQPGTNVTSNDDLKEYLRDSSTPTIAHPCCTAAMMPKRLGGVVSSDLKVYGVNGVSVVDASIMPIIPSTHLQSTVYAVAEKVKPSPHYIANSSRWLFLDRLLISFGPVIISKGIKETKERYYIERIDEFVQIETWKKKVGR